MNSFFEEEREAPLRFDLKALEQPTCHHAKRREDIQEEREAQGENMPKRKGTPIH